MSALEVEAFIFKWMDTLVGAHCFHCFHHRRTMTGIRGSTHTLSSLDWRRLVCLHRIP